MTTGLLGEMAETTYSTEKEFASLNRAVIVSASGTVRIDAKHGTGWVTVDTLTDQVKTLDAYGRTFRFTPTGTATYAIS